MPADLFGAADRGELRRLSGRIMALAESGRLSIELIRDLSRLLRDFYCCRSVETLYREPRRLLRCDFRHGQVPDFFCSIVPPAQTPTAGEPLPLRLLASLSLHAPAEPDSGERHGFDDTHSCPSMLLLTRDDLRSTGASLAADLAAVLVLSLPAIGGVDGVMALGFETVPMLTEQARDGLQDVAFNLGLCLSHNHSRFELRERLKELDCMYAIANLAVREGQDVAAELNRVVALIPPAFLYPDIAEACILLDGRRHATAAFDPSAPAMLWASLNIGGEHRGSLAVTYTASRPVVDEGPFLAEERHLVESLARELSALIERREAEQTRERLQQQLRHADRLATVGQLAAGVAHELNEPLTGILGFAELLADAPDLPASAAPDLDRIQSAALHAREIVRKLLLFAKQIPPRMQAVELTSVVEDVLSFFTGRCAKQSIEVTFNVAPDLPRARADAGQIRQVALNLVVNAIHAMPGGGRLTLSLRGVRDGVELVVEDNGFGMTNEVKEKIFLPFFTTKDVNEGTGLGLSVVHGIIRSHQGSIQVESEEGRGTRFVITLPHAGVEGAAPEEPHA